MRFVPKELKATADISRGRSTPATFVKNSLSVAMVLVILYVALGWIAGLVASYIPESYETRWFSFIVSYDVSPRPISPDFRRGQRLFDRLRRQPGLRPLAYELKLLAASKPNAFAMAGGSVWVSTGLLKNVSNDMGLAMVLAHELGHHQLRHCLKRLGRGLLYLSAQVFLFGTPDPSVINVALHTGESNYSRRQERAADEFGLQLVHEAFGHTRGALEFFEMIQREHESGSSRWTDFLASHPHTGARIKYLRELQRSLHE